MSEDYYSHSRPEVRALIPRSARFVVDVGCGSGAVGAALERDIPGVEVRGIERNPEAASRAALCLHEVAIRAAEDGMPSSWPVPDCVIFADVLEHLVDPWTTLRAWCNSLRPGTCVVASFPNVGHLSVTVPLWKGRWDYGEEGLLDRTHLRFFTRDTAMELLRSAALEIETVQRAILLPEGMFGGWVLKRVVRRGMELERLGRPVPGFQMHVLDACTRQFQFRARVKPGGGPATGEVSA